MIRACSSFGSSSVLLAPSMHLCRKPSSESGSGHGLLFPFPSFGGSRGDSSLNCFISIPWPRSRAGAVSSFPAHRDAAGGTQDFTHVPAELLPRSQEGKEGHTAPIYFKNHQLFAAATAPPPPPCHSTIGTAGSSQRGETKSTFDDLTRCEGDFSVNWVTLHGFDQIKKHFLCT